MYCNAMSAMIIIDPTPVVNLGIAREIKKETRPLTKD